MFHSYQSKTTIGKPNQQQVWAQLQNIWNQGVTDNRKLPSRPWSLSPQGN